MKYVYLYVIILIIIITRIANGMGVDDAFNLQNESATKNFSVEKGVYEKTNKSRSDVTEQFIEKDRRKQAELKAEFNKNLEAGEECKKNNDVCWRIVHQEGDKVTLECLAGKTGHKFDLHRKRNGEWETTSILDTLITGSIDDVAKSECL